MYSQQARKHQCARQHVSHVGAVANQPRVHGEHRTNRLTAAPRHRQAFGQEHSDENEPDDRVGGQHPEHRSPSEVDQQLPADERGENWREAHHQHEHRQHPDRSDLIEIVSDHRTGNDDRRAAAESLQKAERDQRAYAPGPRTRHGRHDKDREAEQERRLPSDRVGQRSVERLSNGHPGKVGGEADLHRCGVGAKLAADRGQRRQIHVDGQRAHRRQRSQDQCEATIL